MVWRLEQGVGILVGIHHVGFVSFPRAGVRNTHPPMNLSTQMSCPKAGISSGQDPCGRGLSRAGIWDFSRLWELGMAFGANGPTPTHISASMGVWQVPISGKGHQCWDPSPDIPEGSQELQEHLREFSRNPARRGHLQKAPQGSATSCPCHALRELHGATSGAGCSCEHIWEPKQQENSCEQLGRDKNATLEHSSRAGRAECK